MKKTMKKVFAVLLSAALATGLCACAATATTAPSVNDVTTKAQQTGEQIATYTIGIYNYLSDKSVDMVVENIRKQLEQIGEANNVRFEVVYEYCNADPEVLDQVVAKYIEDEVDLMIGVATPIAKSFQIMTAGVNFPVIFAALSDPEGAGLVKSGVADADVTAVLNYVDVNAAMQLFRETTPDAENIENMINSFVLSGAIEDFQSDFINLGIEAANMTKSILVDGNNPANIPIVSVENGTVSVSPELCDIFGLDNKEVEEALKPLLAQIGLS